MAMDRAQHQTLVATIAITTTTTASSKFRRGRLRAPAPVPNAVVYKSDGASRRQGRGLCVRAGWGAACWAPTPDGPGEGPPHASCHGYLGADISNNVAEYYGLEACLRRAVRRLDPHVVFQVDSLLACRRMRRHDAWASRSVVFTFSCLVNRQVLSLHMRQQQLFRLIKSPL